MKLVANSTIADVLMIELVFFAICPLVFIVIFYQFRCRDLSLRNLLQSYLFGKTNG